jgi:2,3-bisphosphoglycerate-independent phosphoglycerate mutase
MARHGPRSAVEFLPALERRIAGRATLATVSGRFYAMDRDGRWDRIASAWEAIVHGQGETAPTAAEAIERAHQREESDEVHQANGRGWLRGDGDRDSVVHLNFRADRARQLTPALAMDSFDAFDRGHRPAELSSPR